MGGGKGNMPCSKKQTSRTGQHKKKVTLSVITKERKATLGKKWSAFQGHWGREGGKAVVLPGNLQAVPAVPFLKLSPLRGKLSDAQRKGRDNFRNIGRNE